MLRVGNAYDTEWAGALHGPDKTLTCDMILGNDQRDRSLGQLELQCGRACRPRQFHVVKHGAPRMQPGKFNLFAAQHLRLDKQRPFATASRTERLIIKIRCGRMPTASSHFWLGSL